MSSVSFYRLAGYHPFDVNGDAVKADVLKKIELAEFNFLDPAWEDVDQEGLSTGIVERERDGVGIDDIQ